MVDMLQTGVSGVRTSQASLATTGHNIANINTDGYSRQNVEVETNIAARHGNFFIGQGALVSGIERAYDRFAFTENIMNTSQLGYAKELFTQNNQLDEVLSDENTGATKPVLSAFDAMNGVVDHPNMLESRQVYLENTVNMVNQYNRLYDNLEMQYTGINQDISDSAGTITKLGERISGYNKKIAATLGGRTDSNANDLLDQRDKAITELSKFVNVSVVKADNAMVNIYIGTGQSLVMGIDALEIVPVNGNPDPSRKGLAIKAHDQLIRLDGSHLGGKVSAMYDARKNDIERTFNLLGQNIIGLTHSINEQQKQGQTLEGKIGGNIFNDVNSVPAMRKRVLPRHDDLGTAQLNLRIDNLAELTADDYELVVNDYVAGPPQHVGFDITNKNTGETQSLGPIDLSKQKRIDVPNTGFSIGIDSISATDPIKVGKSFTLRPTRLAAQDVSLQDINSSQIAAADAEIKAIPAEDNTGKGIARVSAIKNRNDALYMDADNPLQIKITDNSNGVLKYDVVDKNGYAVTLPPGSENSFVRFVPPVDENGDGNEDNISPKVVVGDQLKDLVVDTDLYSNKTTLSLAGIDVEIVGDAAVGDTFTLNYNETGDGDNRNIMKMSNLQDQKIMNNKKATFQDVYSGLISEIGAKTKTADVAMESAQVLKNQSYERIQKNSGVNMDEEASNLLKYQQHYSAAARVISVANEIFDTILQASR